MPELTTPLPATSHDYPHNLDNDNVWKESEAHETEESEGEEVKQNATGRYVWTAESHDAAKRIREGTLAAVYHDRATKECEPLAVCMDAMFKYAGAYETLFRSKLKDDGFLGPHFLDTIKGLRGLLNGNGAHAMLWSSGGTDSKDNGWCEAMFWEAMKASGFTEEDL